MESSSCMHRCVEGIILLFKYSKVLFLINVMVTIVLLTTFEEFIELCYAIQRKITVR